MTQTPKIFKRIYDQHGHRCPMSTLGGRMGLAALKSFDGVANSRLSVVFEHGTCAVDGIEITSRCSRSAGTLRVENSGQHSLVMHSGQGSSVRITLNEFALATAWEYRVADEAFNAGKGNLVADELKRLYEQKEIVLQTILEKFWILPDETLLTVEMV
jgi:formylmethanofuran dehydrogenase subunit E